MSSSSSPSSSSYHKFRVAVSGGGIAGATLASALAQHKDIHFDLYEQGRTFETQGAGVALWKKTHNILRSFGLGDAIEDVIPPPSDRYARPAFSIRKADSQDPVQVSKLSIGGSFQLHRTDLLSVLSSRIPASSVHFRRRIEWYEEPSNPSEPILLHLSDGTTAECDVLLACDGVKSNTRRAMFSSPSEAHFAEPHWTGTLAYRGTFPTRLLPASHSALEASMLVYMGEDAYICCYRVKQDEIMNVVAFVSEPHREGEAYGDSHIEPDNSSLLKRFETWEPDVRMLLSHIATPTVWPVKTANLLPTYTKGRVALLGDAAHAMAPHLASGASSALEDVFNIVTLLSHPACTLSTLPAALSAYSAIRRPKGNGLITDSRAQGWLYNVRGPRFQSSAGDRVVDEQGEIDYMRYADAINSRWMRAESGDLEPDVKTITDAFFERLGVGRYADTLMSRFMGTATGDREWGWGEKSPFAPATLVA